MPVEVGDTVEGRYRLLGTLGEGGMGTVFLAEHVLIHRKVALKILHARYASDALVLERFMNEARAAGTLGHPNIVESTDMGFTRDHIPYIAFEYLEGSSLTDEIYRLHGLPVRRALRIAYQIASALEAAHNAGIIHRDLKSDNVFLTDREDSGSDHVKVLDFGVSRFLEMENERSGTGMVLGTPEYMAPEQITAPLEVDARTDVYGLGVILYEMIAGRCPFRADNDPTAVLHKVISELPPPLDVGPLPPGLPEMVFSKLLAKNPAERYRSMKEVAGAIEAFHLIIRPANSRTPLSVPVPEVREEAPVTPTPSRQLVALPQSRRGGSLLLVIGGVLAMAGGTVWQLLDTGSAGSDPSATLRPALEADAKALATTVDASVRAGHLRAEGVASTPMLRAAIETDAATLRDMTNGDFLFTPKPGEVLEVFQLVDNAPVSLVQIPDRAGPTHPLTGNASVLEVDAQGELVVVVSAPIVKRSSAVGGSAVLAARLDLAVVRANLAKYATTARLTGLAKPIELVPGTPADDPIDVVVPLAADLALPPLTLTATAQKAAPAPSGSRLGRFALWGLGGMLFIIYAVSLLLVRTRR